MRCLKSDALVPDRLISDARFLPLTDPCIVVPTKATQDPSLRPSLSPSPANASRDLLRMADFGADLEDVIDAARAIKRLNKGGHPTPYLAAKSAVLIFEKASTRTRVSFEVGLAKLGMTSTFLSTRDIQMGRGESIEDTALVLSRYADVLVYRAFRNEDVKALAQHATSPVVNALDDLEHPCQVAADLMTIAEKKGALAGLRFLYVGDGNNMCHSYLIGMAMAGMHVTVATPAAYAPDSAVVKEAEAIAHAMGGSVTLLHPDDITPLFDGQDVVATDTWISMGDEDEKEQRVKDFAGYTVTSAHMARTNEGVFLHCLPAYYGYEVEKDVAHGPQSAVFDEAENRLWAQMAILVWLLAPWRIPQLAAQGREH
ncbi:MAG: ornithine carbamoyltransferase [Thermoplasmata archaeon]|jgi:ornithine carbamoyltransferase|nr:ornithine carbamoyltransferase [Thermoplasmata archaeon]